MVDRERQKIRHLLIVKDRRGKRAIPLALETYSLGRSEDNSIVLYSSSVSRQHATIIPIADSDNKLAPFEIIDGNLQGIKSTNGLSIDRVKCDRHHLQHGDFIEFGNTAKVTYYTLFNLSDREFAQFCDTQNNSETVKQSILNSQAIVSPAKNLTHVERQTLIRLASFPELIPHPIIEIDLAGFITYINPTAIEQFPQLQTLGQTHSLIVGLPALVQKQSDKHFIQEIKFNGEVFAQSIQYLPEDRVIRILMLDITHLKEEIMIREQSDRLLREVITANHLSFAAKTESLLQISCHFLGLEIGLIGKLQHSSLKITKVYRQQKEGDFLEANQILPISGIATKRIFRLFQATIDNSEPVTLQSFQAVENENNLKWNTEMSGEHLSLTSYLGIQLVVGKKIYGLLAFLSSTTKINEYSPAKIDLLKLIAKWLAGEIERQQMKLVLRNLWQQKKYYQEIATEISSPIERVKAIAQQTQQLVSTLDSQPDRLLETIDDDDESLLSPVEDL